MSDDLAELIIQGLRDQIARLHSQGRSNEAGMLAACPRRHETHKRHLIAGAWTPCPGKQN